MAIADVRSGLRFYLLEDSTIAGLVDSGAGEAVRYRIFPIKLPQAERRASIVYTRISGQGDHHMEGASGLARARLQIDCWSVDPDAAARLADLVKERIDGFRGSIEWDDASPGNAVDVQGIFFDSEREDYDDEVGMYRVSRDYFVWFEELI